MAATSVAQRGFTSGRVHYNALNQYCYSETDMRWYLLVPELNTANIAD